MDQGQLQGTAKVELGDAGRDRPDQQTEMESVFGEALRVADAAQCVSGPRQSIQRLELEQGVEQRGVRLHGRGSLSQPMTLVPGSPAPGGGRLPRGFGANDMSDEQSPDIDFSAAHLRPAQRQEPPPATESSRSGVERIPWEGSRRQGVLPAFTATWWRLVKAPITAFAAVPAAGGKRRPATFALLCGGIFGVISELIDSAMVALVSYGGAGADPAEIFQFDIAGRSLDWLPLSALSAAGCLVGLVVGVPLYVLFYSLLVVVWTSVVHVLLKLTGGLAASGAGYEGTLRAVCYSQVGIAAAIVPWIGDPIAMLWTFCLQVPGLARMHGCSRQRAALAVGLPAAAVFVALLLVVLLGESAAPAG